MVVGDILIVCAIIIVLYLFLYIIGVVMAICAVNFIDWVCSALHGTK